MENSILDWKYPKQMWYVCAKSINIQGELYTIKIYHRTYYGDYKIYFEDLYTKIFSCSQPIYKTLDDAKNQADFFLEKLIKLKAFI